MKTTSKGVGKAKRDWNTADAKAFKHLWKKDLFFMSKYAWCYIDELTTERDAEHLRLRSLKHMYHIDSKHDVKWIGYISANYFYSAVANCLYIQNGDIYRLFLTCN